MDTTMPPERATHAILHLIGQTHALFLVCQALVRTHPFPEKLLEEINGLSQRELVNLELLPEAGDVVIDGYQFVN